MTKSKIVEIFKRLDDEKFTLLPRGVAFELVIRDKAAGQYMHTGIGDGLDMSLMSIYSIVSLYTTVKNSGQLKGDVSIEAFAESVKQQVIKAYNDNLFSMEDINGGVIG